MRDSRQHLILVPYARCLSREIMISSLVRTGLTTLNLPFSILDNYFPSNHTHLYHCLQGSVRSPAY